MRTSLLLALVVVAFACISCTSVVADGEEVEWIQPAFLESDSSPVASFNHEVDPHSMVESTVSAEAAVDMAVAATITAQGKTESQLMAEIEARGPAMWAEWKAKFKKVVGDETNRLKVFLGNLLRIAKANAAALFSSVPKALRVVYSHMTPYADRTEAEFRVMLGALPNGTPALKVAAPAPKRVIAAPGQTAAAKSTRAPIGNTASKTPKGVKVATKKVAKKSFMEIATEIDAESETEADADVDSDVDADSETDVDADSDDSFLEQSPRTIVEASVRGETTSSAPVDVDFRVWGSPIISQGKCGSCYAFAATHVLESTWAIKTTKKLRLSPQQVMDCFNPTRACKGGNPTGALKWWRDNGGALKESDMPYLAADGPTCRRASGADAPKPKDVSFAIPLCRAGCAAPDEKEMGHQLSSNGPLLVIMDASAYQFYKSGVMGSDAPCSKDPVKGNHALSIEGLGTDNKTGLRYWIVRNSWGPAWGEEGRLRMAFGKNLCGLANTVTKVTM